MSQKAIEKIQAMQQQDPSLSQRIETFLESLVGEPVEYFMVMLSKHPEKGMLVSTAGWLDETNAADAPAYLLQALATMDEGYVRLQKIDTGKH